MKNVICKWSLTLPLSFNTLSFGHLFKRNDFTLITGHEDGGIRVYTMPDSNEDKSENVEIESADTYETKGGPILQQIVCDITRLSSNDLITSDSKGLVTFLSAGRILCRKSVSGNCIICLELFESGMGHMAVIAADNVGNLYSFSHYADFWSLRLSDVKNIAASARSTEVTCVQCVTLKNRHSQVQTFTVVATRSRHVLFINSIGNVVLTLDSPATVTAMTVGRFVEPRSIVSDEEELVSVRGAMDTQLVLGCDSGAILLLVDYQLCEGEYAQLPMAIRQLDRLPSPDQGFNDTLCCLGPSNILSIVQGGQEVAQYSADARITSMVVPKKRESEDWPDIVIGCSDKTVHGLRISSDEPMIVASA